MKLELMNNNLGENINNFKYFSKGWNRLKYL